MVLFFCKALYIYFSIKSVISRTLFTLAKCKKTHSSREKNYFFYQLLMPFSLFRCKACGSWAIEWFFPPNLFPFFSVLRFSFRFFPATPSFSIADLISSAHVLLGLHSFFLLSKVHASRIRLFILSSPILFMCPKPALPSFFDSLQGWFFFQVYSKSGVPYSVFPGFFFYFSNEPHVCALFSTFLLSC
jgi:hypothetical protein